MPGARHERPGFEADRSGGDGRSRPAFRVLFGRVGLGLRLFGFGGGGFLFGPPNFAQGLERAEPIEGVHGLGYASSVLLAGWH